MWFMGGSIIHLRLCLLKGGGLRGWSCRAWIRLMGGGGFVDVDAARKDACLDTMRQ